MFDLSQHFHAYVLTLDGWDHRLRQFMDRANELGVVGFEVLYGVGGDKIRTPNWWKRSGRKFACNMAHLNAVHRGIMAGEHPILVLEDDAHLRRNFIESIQEVIAFFRDHDDATVCYLGGRIHGKGRKVSRLIERGVRVGGGYGYCISQKHAPIVSGYIMDRPIYMKGGHRFAQDTKMMWWSQHHDHATVRPVCVGHRGGRSVLLKRNRKGRHIDE